MNLAAILSHTQCLAYGGRGVVPQKRRRYPTDQNTLLEGADVLINVARDCLEYLASNQPIAASSWCDRLDLDGAPISSQGSLYIPCQYVSILTQTRNSTGSYPSIDLHDLAARHETFRALSIIYITLARRHVRPSSTRSSRTSGRIKTKKTVSGSAAYEYFRLLHWLHKCEGSCQLAEHSLERLLSRYPDFKPSELTDLLHYTTSSQPVAFQSPWSVAELLSRPAKESVDDLLTFTGEGSLDLSRGTLLRTLAETAYPTIRLST